ncbi:MAG: hypothetical protein K1060chlam3_00052 [Candidatus Anoxychlamydiales bacterium]|nr:hypothetical protein [Candidatus Anoxychlamydiales bacterium]
MFVNVKTEKRQQTNECHLSLLLFSVQLNKVQKLSVAQEKTCFNSSREGLGYLFVAPIEWIIEHYWSLYQRYFFLISILSRHFLKNLNWRVGISSHT